MSGAAERRANGDPSVGDPTVGDPTVGDPTGGAADVADAAPGMRVVAGAPTPEELAAVTAVLQAAAIEAEHSGRARVDGAPRSAWDESVRGLRQPLQPGSWGRSLR